MNHNDYSPAGWKLLGSYPKGDPDGVGSWILHNNGESALVELPYGLRVTDVCTRVYRLGTLTYVCASHEHRDHLDWNMWKEVQYYFPYATYIRPHRCGYKKLNLGGEPLYILECPKHSMTDCVIIFRGVAMTGDLELGIIHTVNDEVPLATRRQSYQFLRDFPKSENYHIHTVMTAHLNDIRKDVDWPSLFPVEDTSHE